MYSVMDYWYITTRPLCPIFWEMPTTNIFDKSELILCVNRGWKPQQSMMDMLCRMLRLFPPPLKHCDWACMIGVSVLIKGHSRIESTLKKQDFTQWYTTVRLTMAYLQLWIQPLMALHWMKMLWKIVQQMYVCHCDFLQE